MNDDLPTDLADEEEPECDWYFGAAYLILLGSVFLGGLRGFQSLLAYAAGARAGAAAVMGAIAEACSEVLLCGLVGLWASSVVRALGTWSLTHPSTIRPLLPGDGAATGPLPDPPSPPPVAPPFDPPARLAEIRRLVHEQDWEAAREAVQSFQDQHPGDVRGERASVELDRAMQGLAARLSEQLEAARRVNDPDQVLEIHGRIRVFLNPEQGRELDAELARWLLSIVHRRLRAGRIQADVVALADRIVEGFGHTTDGASLRASLPTLRRSAGLCPRCGKPYTGLAPACPECLKPAAPPPSFPELNAEEVDEPAAGSDGHDLFAEPPE